MRESNLYEYGLSLLAVSRDPTSRFELCQFDEMFSICITYNLNKTFCVDHFARSLPASTLAAKSRRRKIRRRSPRANNVGNLQNLAFYDRFCSSIAVLCFSLCALGRRKGVITCTIGNTSVLHYDKSVCDLRS